MVKISNYKNQVNEDKKKDGSLRYQERNYPSNYKIKLILNFKLKI